MEQYTSAGTAMLKNTPLLRKKTSNIRFKKQGNVYGAEGISKEREVFIEEKYKYPPSVIRPVITAQQGQNENAPSNDSSEEKTWSVQSLTARRSTKERRATERFEDYAKVAVEDPVSMAEAMNSTDREHWRLAIDKEPNSIDDSGTRTKASSPRR